MAEQIMRADPFEFAPERPPQKNNPYAPDVDPHRPEDDERNAWRIDALCSQTDPEAFFPEKGGSTRDAKKVCASCDVREECLEYALRNDERFGIWGGLSERERRKMKRGDATARHRLSEQRRKEAIAMAAEGLTAKQIGARLGLSEAHALRLSKTADEENSSDEVHREESAAA